MPTSTRPRSRATQGAGASYKNLADEPDDHGIGRSCGGLSTKIHNLTDGAGGPLVVLIGPGQAGDSPMFAILFEHLRVPRPERVGGYKAYSSRATRALLRSRGLRAVIAEPDDQIRHRKSRGRHDGRPPDFDVEDYKNRKHSGGPTQNSLTDVQREEVAAIRKSCDVVLTGS